MKVRVCGGGYAVCSRGKRRKKYSSVNEVEANVQV